MGQETLEQEEEDPVAARHAGRGACGHRPHRRHRHPRHDHRHPRLRGQKGEPQRERQRRSDFLAPRRPNVVRSAAASDPQPLRRQRHLQAQEEPGDRRRRDPVGDRLTRGGSGNCRYVAFSFTVTRIL